MKGVSTTTVNKYLAMPWHYSSEASKWEGEKGFWVWVAELPDCSTFSNSLEDGLAKLPSLLSHYLKVAVASKARENLNKSICAKSTN